MDETSIQTRLLDAAETLCRLRGYNAFSYRNLADVVGIKTASIHYHYPTKGDLGRALVIRYRHRFESARAGIDRQGGTAVAKLRQYVNLLKAGKLDDQRACLCGILAAESNTLPELVEAEVKRFFTESESWIANVLREGKSTGAIRLSVSPETVASSMFAALQGALMTARVTRDEHRLDTVAEWIFSGLNAAT